MELMGKYRRLENRSKKKKTVCRRNEDDSLIRQHRRSQSTPQLVLKCNLRSQVPCTENSTMEWRKTERKKYGMNKFKRVNSFMMTTHLSVIQ